MRQVITARVVENIGDEGVDERLQKLCHRGLTKRFDEVCVRDALRCTTKGFDERFDEDL